MVTAHIQEKMNVYINRLQRKYRLDLAKKYNIELFKDIEGYEGLYQISSHGRVWSIQSQIFLKSRSNKNRRCRVSLQKDGKVKDMQIHRLVLFAFKGPPLNYHYETRHLDGNPKNNYIDNLEWGTKSENYKDRIKHGTGNHGENHGQTHLTEQDIKNIRLLRDKRFTYKAIAEKYNISTSQAYRIIFKESWKHVK